MKIGIIGAGNMGSLLARDFSKAKHNVVLGARDTARAKEVANEVGLGVQYGSIEDAVKHGDLVFLAVPYLEIPSTLEATGSLDGKIVVDMSNPFKPGFTGLRVGGDTSAAEELAKLLPKAKVIKAYNSVFATALRRGPDFSSMKMQILYAGDDTEAKDQIAKLIASTGFTPIDAGSLLSARFMEPLSALLIQIDNHLDRDVQITSVIIERTRETI